MRVNTFNLLSDLKNAFVVFATISVFVFFASNTVYFFFRNSLQGFTYFYSIYSSYSNMLVLLTSANFPDVMLPAYEDRYIYCGFFILFILSGMFFLMNLLLANIYNKFKERLEQQDIYYLKKQARYLEAFIDRYDPEDKGFLTTR